MVPPLLFVEYWILLLKVLSSRNNVLNCYKSDVLTHQDLPRAALSPDIKRNTAAFTLADPTFDTPAPIEIFLGADLFAQIMTGEQYILGKDLPIAFGTDFWCRSYGSHFLLYTHRPKVPPPKECRPPPPCYAAAFIFVTLERNE
ncbi:unnamed protein product [Timema podura]|uniref:Uncharacterized protein n=1 Tax=Timema podura TaxID=61482 RepID=A0ABN7NZG9_TIMPD|nr:unnamed protein product [Timema podura]